MPMTIADGFEGDDPDLYVALAVISMTRAGKVERTRMMDVADELSEVPFDNASITIVGDTVEADEVPLDLTPTPEEPSPTNLLSSVG
jgi:hypothetical protein